MAIDLEAIRRKHAEISNGPGTGGDTSFLDNFLQLQEGNNVVRLLPGKDEETNFYAETKIHRVMGSDSKIRNVHCRKIHSEKCPLCDLYYSLWKTGVKDDETLARQIKPRSRYYMNVVDRETAKVKILSVGIMLFQKVLNTILDEDYGDITDLQSGHDFKIIKVMEGQFPKYDQSQARPKPSEAGTKAEVAAWMDTLHDVHALVKFEEYEDVANVAEEITPPSLKAKAYTDAPENEGSDDEFLNKMQS
tara:strand:+ start:71 stop:814 length:744 start_codon:yes stop_codon:yes gene_type:complete